ncbi:MAG: YceI family protein [Burkholderiales bacterium]
MKRAVLAGAILAALPLAAAAQSESYTLDPIHTFTHFSIDYLGYATFFGRFDKTSGKFTIDRSGKKGTLDLLVETASVNTGDNDKGSRPRSRDEHLRSPDFFNVAEFPRMSYKATSVKFSGDNPSEIEGQLTLLGVTKPLTLKVERWACKDHPFYKKPTCGGNASGVVKRTDFGMKYLVQLLGDEIKFTTMFLGFRD